MTALTHFAHPRGWLKGEPVKETVCCTMPAVERETVTRPTPGTPPAAEALVFTNPAHRSQWLKWWRKP